MSLAHLEVLNGAQKECYWHTSPLKLPECFFLLSTANSLGAVKYNWPDHKLFTFFL